MNKNRNKILVVDDSDSNRMMLSFMLESFSYQVDEADDGIKAIEQALEHYYVAVFMDINMPKMNGLDATLKLRSLNYSLPIFACSAEENSSKIEKLLSSGFTDFVPKPIEPESIQHILQKHQIDNQPSRILDHKALEHKLKHLGSLFVQSVPNVILDINRALDRNNITDLKRIAHKMKGTASQFGFELVSILGRDIELAISKNELTIAIEKVQLLVKELKKLG